MASVLIAAHNEGAVIRRCVDAVLSSADPPPQVIVVANACHDDTATAAGRPGVEVIETTTGGKAFALNLGEQYLTELPRLYLDADIVVPPGAIAALVAAVEDDPATLAAVPARRLVTAGRPPLVRAFFAINRRLPAYSTGLFGRGLVALSAAGRTRFEQFPVVIADDLYLDSLFTDAEKRVVESVVVDVETPYTTRELFRRLVRVRRGNAGLRRSMTGVRASRRWSWLHDVVMPQPSLAPAAVVYVLLTGLAALTARRPAKGHGGWETDGTTRR